MSLKNTALGIIGAIAIAAPVSISCEEDDEGTGEVSSEVAPEAVAESLCERYFACTCEMREGANVFSSVEACELALAQNLQEAIDEGEQADLTYNGACPGRQIDLANDLGCQSLSEVILDLQAAAQFEDYENCKLFHGQRGPGQTCEELDQSNGDSCEADLRCSMGICITLTGQLEAGEACMLVADSGCATGLVCIDVDGGTDNPTCESLPRGGETCKGTANLCDVDFACNIENKTCIALPNVGEDCAATPSVLGWTCGRGALCNVDTDMCIAAPGGGEACDGVCQEGFSCENGRCAEEAALVCLVDVGNM